jgi:hypothetical protein
VRLHVVYTRTRHDERGDVVGIPGRQDQALVEAKSEKVADVKAAIRREIGDEALSIVTVTKLLSAEEADKYHQRRADSRLLHQPESMGELKARMRKES